MKKYGETLRSIREQKGYTMQKLAEGILSVSFLSKFERGESDISFSHITQLLEKLSISFEEFFHLHEVHHLNRQDYFFTQAEDAYTNRDLQKLYQLKELANAKWNEQHFKSYKCNVIMLDVFISMIDNKLIDAHDEDVNFLFTYLFDVEIWGYYELSLYNYTMFLMDKDMIMSFSKIAFEKSARFRHVKKIDKIILPILLNTLIVLLASSTFDEKLYNDILNNLEQIPIPEEELYLRNSLLQVKGLYEMKIGNEEKGIAMVRQSIAIYETLGATQLAYTSENYLQIVLRKQQLSETELKSFIQDL